MLGACALQHRGEALVGGDLSPDVTVASAGSFNNNPPAAGVNIEHGRIHEIPTHVR